MHCKAYISMEQAHSHTPRDTYSGLQKQTPWNPPNEHEYEKNSQRIFAALRSICAKNVIVLMRLSF